MRPSKPRDRLARRAISDTPRRANHWLNSAPLVPIRGAYRDRHERGTGCGGREGVGAQTGLRGGSNRERSRGAQDERRLSVRQNRVVLTPVAGAKLSVARSIQPDRAAFKPTATV